MSSRGLFPRINENSEASIDSVKDTYSQTPSNLAMTHQSRDKPMAHFREYENQLMFRKHNPNYRILENINVCGLPNYRDGKILGGGGSKIQYQKPEQTVPKMLQTDLVVQES